ncbi:MAG: glutamyl-tRNA amidotransferase, partial [Acidobacteria bacterium]|nr:glutamyl-tRNA amidotransferase [Acidobacteriota bacterium]
TLKPGFPTTLAGLIEDAVRVNGREDGGAAPNPGRWRLMREEEGSGELSDSEYRAIREHGLPLVRAAIEGIMDAEDLAAIVYPTSPRRPGRADIAPAPSGGGGRSATRYANLTGFPDLIVPAGFTGEGLPVGLSFLGRAFDEPRLLALGYAFEQATRARRLPAHTPPLGP